MFIKSSQRRSNGAPAPYLSLHRYLARGRVWRRRLFICSSAALAVSLGAWLLDLSLILHLALVGAGFLAGFAPPLGRTEPWALGWIDDHAGLSYRTALEQTSLENTAEYSSEQTEEDRYGFRQALSAQAEHTTQRLELPAAQPWWLPLLAVALSLAVLPALNFPDGLGGGLGGSNAGGNAPLSPNENAPLGDAEADGNEADGAEAPQTPEDAAQSAQPELERTEDALGEDPASGNEGNSTAQSTDSETLENYLESLEGQEAQDNAQPGESDAANNAPGDTGRNPFASEPPREQGGEQTQGESPEGAEQSSQSGEQGQQGEQSQQEQEGQQGQQNEGEGAQDAGGEGGTDQPPEETQSPREGEQEAGGAGGTPSEQEQQAEGESPQQAQGESEGSQEGEPQEGESQASSPQSETGEPSQGESAQGGSAGPQEGEQEGSASEGEATNGSGSLPSESSPSAGERLEGTPQSPERLEGQRGGGVTNRAGQTLAPGTDEVAIPNERTAAEYERAAEEAINEGRIPVEYQDILRNYFR